MSGRNQADRVGRAHARLYRALLIAYPPEFRRKNRDEMTRLFRERVRDARASHSALWPARVWTRALADIAVNAPAERARALTRRRREARTPRARARRVAGPSRGGLDPLLKDIQYAARTLIRNPGFTAIAVLTLGLGIGANTAIFSVVRAVLLRPLPYADPDRVAIVWGRLTARNVESFPLSPTTLGDLRERSTTFEGFAGVLTVPQPLTGGQGDPEQIEVALVTPNLPSLLGIAPALGRDFRPEDALFAADTGGAAPGGAAAPGPLAPPTVVILSHGLWQRRFGGDPEVVGRTVTLNGNAVEVIGVMPPDVKLHFPPGSGVQTEVDAWVPPRIDFESWPRANSIFVVIGRLSPEARIEGARAEMDRIARDIRAQAGLFETAGFELDVVPLQRDLTEDVRPVILALLGAVGFVLLIACANVSNLLLVRAVGRERELAVRAALGGSRGRLIRQLLVESGCLAGLGAVVGLALAYGGIQLLLRLRPENLPRVETIGMDGLVLGFTLAASALSAVVFGVMPSLRASKLQLSESLKDRGRSSTLARQRGLRNAAVVAEMALSVVLLIGAGLMVRSFIELQNVDPGYDPEGVLTFSVQMPATRYPEPAERSSFAMRLNDRIAGLPGVESAGAVFPTPLDGAPFSGRYGTEEALADESFYRQAAYRVVLPGYFETMRTRLLAGRTFSRADQIDSARVVVVDRMLAERTWPGASAVGKRMLVRLLTPEPEWVEVIGVVEHMRVESLSEDGRETIYFTDRYAGGFGVLTWTVRAEGDPARLTGRIRSRVAEMDPSIPIADVRTLETRVSDARAPTRFALLLIGIFAIIALVLATIGLYGVVAFLVRQRTAEIGVRMAFGAGSGSIVRLVVGQGMALSAVGTAAGLLGALGLTRAMSSLLVEVTPTDPLTFAGIGGLFLIVGAAASWIPARRAARLDPVIALREG